MQDSKTLFWSTKFPRGQQTISLKFRGNLGTRPRNGTTALDCTNELRIESCRRAGSTLRIREVPCSNLTSNTEYPEALRGCVRYLRASRGTVLSMCYFQALSAASYPQGCLLLHSWVECGLASKNGSCPTLAFFILYGWLSGLMQTRQPPIQSENYQCRIDTVRSPDDGHIVARNMYRSLNKYTKK